MSVLRSHPLPVAQLAKPHRQSVKEQHEQDQRRHEQQIQQLQAELRQALHDAQESSRRAMQWLEALQAVEQRNGALSAQLAEKDAQAHALQEHLTAAPEREKSLTVRVRDLELTLAQSQAKYEAQQEW